MGDRANVQLNDGEGTIWLYTHWGAPEMADTVMLDASPGSTCSIMQLFAYLELKYANLHVAFNNHGCRSLATLQVPQLCLDHLCAGTVSTVCVLAMPGAAPFPRTVWWCAGTWNVLICDITSCMVIVLQSCPS